MSGFQYLCNAVEGVVDERFRGFEVLYFFVLTRVLGDIDNFVCYVKSERNKKLES
jgi:hypothetical protein